MKKVLTLVLISFLCMGAVMAANTYQGNPIVKVLNNGKQVPVQDVPAVIYQNRTMIPLYMLENFGYQLEWNQQDYSVNVTPKQETQSKKELTMDEIQEIADCCVARVYVYDKSKKYVGQGSGFVINSRGLFITNYHVADIRGELGDMQIELNGKVYHTSDYLFYDKEKDIFAVMLPGVTKVPFIKISNTLPKYPDKSYVIGSPKGETNKITEGYISASYQNKDGTMIISSSAESDIGSSGGVMLNKFGEAVAVMAWGPSSGPSIFHVKELYEESFNK